MNDSAFIHEADQGRRFFQGKHGTSKSEKPNEKADAGTTHDKTQPDHYADLIGMNLWELVKPLPFIEGNILKYIWRAGLKEDVPAVEDYAKALTYLDKVDEATSLDISNTYFEDLPYKDLIETMHGWDGDPQMKEKSACLFYFFGWVQKRRYSGSSPVSKQKLYYGFLHKALEDAIAESSYTD